MNIGSKEIFVNAAHRGAQYPSGMIAWFDGIWNASVGRHSTDTTVWKDLAGSNDATKSGSGISWKDSCWTNATQGQGFAVNASLTQAFQTSYTAEFLVKPSRTSTREAFGSAWNGNPGISFEHNEGSSSVGYPRWYYDNNTSFNYMITSSKLTAGNMYLLDYARDGNSLKVFVNGQLVWTKSDSYANPGTAVYHIGADVGRPMMAFYGDFFKHIVWNRPLSAEEVAYNYAIDKVRFGI